MYNIILCNETNKIVRTYKSDILPVVGDFIEIDEKTLFRVNNRLLYAAESITIMLTGSLVPNTLY